MRRHRTADGKRIRKKARRWNALRLQDPDDRRLALACDAACEIGWKPPRELGLWSIDTTNPNAWTTGKRQALSRSAADIILMQETKQRLIRIAQAKRQAEHLGWRAHFGPALVTSAKGTSGGVAVVSRKGLGSTPHEIIPDAYKHRIGGAWISAVVKGGIHVFSVYLKDGQDLSETNAAILTQLAAAIGSVRGPWVVGGDWNMTPQTLKASNWPATVKGHICAPSEPTCFDNTYDFFVVSDSLSGAVVDVKRISDGGCYPHWMARLYLHGAARAKAVRRLVRPDHVPGVLPLGPLGKSLSTNQRTDDEPSMSNWYSSARAVWASLMATTPTVDTHKFRWEAATGRTACPDAGATAVSASLRAMAKRLDDSLHLLSKGNRPDDPRITTNAKLNREMCDKKQLKAPCISTVTLKAWCQQTELALSAGDVDKAKKLHETIQKKPKASSRKRTNADKTGGRQRSKEPRRANKKPLVTASSRPDWPTAGSKESQAGSTALSATLRLMTRYLTLTLA
jgi:exonuclease III